MRPEGNHHISKCADPSACPQHQGNVIPEDGERALRLLDFAKANDVPGMIPRGTIVEKQTWEPGDLHRLGSRATIIGCFGVVDGVRWYFVEWEDLPGHLGFVIEPKIKRARPAAGVPSVLPQPRKGLHDE